MSCKIVIYELFCQFEQVYSDEIINLKKKKNTTVLFVGEKLQLHADSSLMEKGYQHRSNKSYCTGKKKESRQYITRCLKSMLCKQGNRYPYISVPIALGRYYLPRTTWPLSTGSTCLRGQRSVKLGVELLLTCPFRLSYYYYNKSRKHQPWHRI